MNFVAVQPMLRSQVCIVKFTGDSELDGISQLAKDSLVGRNREAPHVVLVSTGIKGVCPRGRLGSGAERRVSAQPRMQ